MCSALPVSGFLPIAFLPLCAPSYRNWRDIEVTNSERDKKLVTRNTIVDKIDLLREDEKG